MRAKLQLHVTLGIAALLVGHWASGGSRNAQPLYALAAFVSFEALASIVLTYGMSSVREHNRVFENRKSALLPEEARHEALAFLASDRCEVVRQDHLVTLDSRLPASIVEIFSTYETIRLPLGEVLALGEVRDDFVDIGRIVDAGHLKARIAGSPQESDEVAILRSFLHGDEFRLGRRHALRLEQQITNILVASSPS